MHRARDDNCCTIHLGIPSFFLAYKTSSINIESVYSNAGVLEIGGQLPPNFAEFSPKLLQNEHFPLKFLFFAPALLVMLPHL